MAEKTGERKAEGRSQRWKIAAGAGLVLILVALIKWGVWAAAVAAFLVFLVLAYGKPYKRYRKFVYRGVLPAGFIILIVSYLLDWLLPEFIPDPVTRLFFSFAMAVPCGIVPVLALTEIYGRARLHWVTALSPDLDRKEALKFLKSLYFGLNYPVMVVGGGQSQTTREGGPGGFLQKVGGPGLIFVNYGYAAVLECGGKYTRVVKGGARFLELYESPRAIVDLRRQQKTLQVSKVYTRDGVPLDIELRLWYQIRRKKDTGSKAAPATEKPSQDTTQPPFPPQSLPSNLSPWRRVLAGLASFLWSLAVADKSKPSGGIPSQTPKPNAASAPTENKTSEADATVGSPDLIDMAMQGAGGAKPPPASQKDYFAVADEDIVDAVYNVDNWQASVEAMAGHVLRDVVAERDLDAMFDYDFAQRQFLPRKIIRQTVWGRMNRFLQQERWGVEVVLVDMGVIALFYLTSPGHKVWHNRGWFNYGLK